MREDCKNKPQIATYRVQYLYVQTHNKHVSSAAIHYLMIYPLINTHRSCSPPAKQENSDADCYIIMQRKVIQMNFYRLPSSATHNVYTSMEVIYILAQKSNFDIILQDQDVRQRHHPGEQNRKDEWYGVDPTDGFDEEQYNIQSLS